MIAERDYVSPDGALRFLVRSPDGDITMGFDNYPWHTHGDVLAGWNGLPNAEVAAEQFIDDLISSKLIIAVSYLSGTIRDIWITEDPVSDLRYCGPDETIEFRRWDGTKVRP